MKVRALRIRHFWLALGTSFALAACGGGGSGGPAASGSSSGSGAVPSSSSTGSNAGSSSSSSGAATVSNQIAIVVNSGPPAASPNTFNIPYASVKVCVPGTNQCATINNLQVDTGSSGLRIFSSVLSNAGVTLTPLSDPANAANTIGECQAFVGGYVWGAVATANVQMASETATNLSVHVIDDAHSYAAVPSACTQLTSSTSLNNVKAIHANGVLGIGVFPQDCGSMCAECASFNNGCTSTNDFYYSCSGSTTCTPTPVGLTAQVDNPISLFATDNNGSIIALPSVGSSGKASVTGTLTFGIGTQSNNALPTDAAVLTLDDNGFFTSTFNGNNYDSSFLDSGSNGFYFTYTVTRCGTTGTSAYTFYCPNSTISLSAVNQGHDQFGQTTGATSTVDFSIANLNTLLANNGFAYGNVGGSAAISSGSNSLSNDFDFGLPFFYGRSVFTGIAATNVRPFVAY